MSKTSIISKLAQRNSVLQDRLYDRETALATKLRAMSALYEMVDRVVNAGGKHAPWWGERLTHLSNLFSQYDKTIGELEDAVLVNEYLSTQNEQLLTKVADSEKIIKILTEDFNK